jgi:D-3-phosphoglycerate dehydrogenase / 2-oxoglutarate reductase
LSHRRIDPIFIDNRKELFKMQKIWFEGSVPADFSAMVNGAAEGICPGDRRAQDSLYMLDEADGVIAGGLTYNAELMRQAPRLLIIARAGIGYEKVDVPAATAHGIAVCNTPDAPTISTAECALTLMMGVARNIKRVEKDLRSMLETGNPKNVWGSYVALELSGMQLGLVGLGRIGGHVAKVAGAMGMRVAAYDPYIAPERAAKLGVERVDSLERLLGMADVASVHVPLTPETYRLMNVERFVQMKRGAIFINVSRGGIVDEAALIAALESGTLFGAGLDVTDPEPPEAGNPLLSMDNVILTPHIGSATLVGRKRIMTDAMERTLIALRGEQPPDLLNPEVWPRVLERRAALL